MRNAIGAVSTYTHGVDSEVVKSSTGVYYIDIDLDRGGTWYVRWFSTGTGQASEESKIDVRRHYAVS